MSYVYGHFWPYTKVIKKILNKTVQLSVQQLTDCSSNSNYWNYGCQGGNVWNAYRYIYENGIIEDSAYPFTSDQTGNQVNYKIYKYICEQFVINS